MVDMVRAGWAGVVGREGRRRREFVISRKKREKNKDDCEICHQKGRYQAVS